MRILLLCEGDAETADSWSGLTLSLLSHLRAEGHTVLTGDVDLYGWARWWTAARTFARPRRRWSARYHLGPQGFAARSRNAAEHLARYRRKIDWILQIGATAQLPNRGSIPQALYCDSNIAWAELGRATGATDASVLRESELGLIRQREHAIYARADLIFTLSEQLKGSFVTDFAVPPERVKVVYAGPNIDLASIESAPAERGGARAPTVLFVGKQFERKGGPLLLRAFRRVRKELPDTRLVIIGPPDLRMSDPGVECLGFISKDGPGGWQAISAAYRAADVFCLPTRFEPFGVAFLEAMHFGLPCIGTNVWAVPEIIVDGETGYVVPVEDEDALAARLCQLLRDRDRARAMGEAGRARARERFTWAAVARAMTRAMSESLTQAGARA